MSHEAPHSISIHACAAAFSVPTSQVHQWIKRGKLNSKRGINGRPRIYVDGQYRRFKSMWLGSASTEQEAVNPSAVRGGWGQ